jgi:hypothetical protein
MPAAAKAMAKLVGVEFNAITALLAPLFEGLTDQSEVEVI